MRYFVPVGRVLYSAIFILAALGHFSKQTIGYAAQQGVPLASIAVPLSGVMALLGGLSVALGYKAKWGAWLLVLFLAPVTVMLHNFWAVKEPMAPQMQQINVHEEPFHAGRCASRLLLWRWSLEPGCPAGLWPLRWTATAG